MVSQTIQIGAPLQTVYDCVLDFESYPQFLTDVKTAKIAWCEDKQMEVAFSLHLIKDISYTLSFELDPPHGIYWKLKNGQWMKKNTGSWELKSLSGEKTSAKYSLDVELSLWVPQTITAALVEKTLPQTLKAFKKRSEKIFRKK